METSRKPLGLPELLVRLSLGHSKRIIEFGFIVKSRQGDISLPRS